MKTIYSELERLCTAVTQVLCCRKDNYFLSERAYVICTIVRNKSCSVVKAIYSQIERICAEVRKKILNVLKTVTQC